MISVNTNTAASQALQSLTKASSEVQEAQQQTSTGLKVGSAKDDGATWSIAQNLRSAVAGWQTVSDNISRGQSILDVAANGAANISDVLGQLKTKALSLSDPSLDATSQSAIKDDMIALIKQIDSIAANADFNGVNLLNSSEQVGGGSSGPQQLSVPAMYPSPFGDQHVDYVLPQTLAPGTFTFTFTASPFSWHGFDLQMPSGGIQVTTTDQPSQVQTYHANEPVWGLGAWAPLGTDYSVTYQADAAPANASPAYQLVTDPHGGTTALDHWDLSSGGLGLLGLDWTNPSGLITAVSDAMFIVQRAATTIGSQQNGLDLRQKGATVEQDTLQAGISNLVDADMAKEAAKLTAAQTKQQLATQTLAISNSSAQTVLSLFR